MPLLSHCHHVPWKIKYNKKMFYGVDIGSVKTPDPTERFTNIDNAKHHGFMKCSMWGATRSGRIHASLPKVIALFSTSDLLTPYFYKKGSSYTTVDRVGNGQEALEVPLHAEESGLGKRQRWSQLMRLLDQPETFEFISLTSLPLTKNFKLWYQT